ncbi:GspH/FimT family pseudopilin [Massilia sp. PAMC28688]|uniref:pilus assembly FimT family protein n=1 Tax=Massilia sp. PAMC28688 TaxID=2861283 RepID=UPI001C62DFA2|nr:GspH/FimT family pseudopilin [Massilia sp. PAMC28688]QYF92869.1 GspH/FimT family pseudopilin [Massilia sp. PAMC28688]
MHAITTRRPSGGFTLLELLIGLAILAFLMMLAAPSFSNWQLRTRSAAASQYYLEAFRSARLEAVKRNSTSRLVLTENAATGQFDWRVDICFRNSERNCDRDSDDWSSVDAAAPGDPGAVGYRSVSHSAGQLLKASVMQPTLVPDGATSVYFTSTGWVNTALAPNLNRIELASTDDPPAFRRTAVALTLAGGASICLPDDSIDVTDSRRCP